MQINLADLTTQTNLFKGVPVRFIDIRKEISGPLQGGGFVHLLVTERHQHVQLITAQANPPPAQEAHVYFKPQDQFLHSTIFYK